MLFAVMNWINCKVDKFWVFSINDFMISFIFSSKKNGKRKPMKAMMKKRKNEIQKYVFIFLRSARAFWNWR